MNGPLLHVNRKASYSRHTHRVFPVLEGLVMGLAIMLGVSISSRFIYIQSIHAVEEEIKAGMLRNSSAAAALIDGDLHRSFRSITERGSASYERALAPLRQVLAASKDVRYLYTCVLDHDQVYLVLNPSPQDDFDGDGQPDPAPELMTLYADASAELRRALRQQIPLCTEPYRDQWGHFVSAYAPFYDHYGAFVGVLGMDLELVNYEARLQPVKTATWRTAVVGAWLAVLCGITVWFTRRISRRLNDSRNRIIDHLLQSDRYARTLNQLSLSPLGALVRGLGSLLQAMQAMQAHAPDRSALLGYQQQLAHFVDIALLEEGARPTNFQLTVLFRRYCEAAGIAVIEIDPNFPAQVAGHPRHTESMLAALFSVVTAGSPPSKARWLVRKETRNSLQVALQLQLVQVEALERAMSQASLQGGKPDLRLAAVQLFASYHLGGLELVNDCLVVCFTVDKYLEDSYDA